MKTRFWQPKEILFWAIITIISLLRLVFGLEYKRIVLIVTFILIIYFGVKVYDIIKNRSLNEN